MTPTHERMLVEIGSKIRIADVGSGKRGKRGWKSAACRLAIEALYAQVIKDGIDIDIVRFYVAERGDTKHEDTSPRR